MIYSVVIYKVQICLVQPKSMGTGCEDRLQEDLRNLFLIRNVLKTGKNNNF